jgi:hypothetical protein
MPVHLGLEPPFSSLRGCISAPADSHLHAAVGSGCSVAVGRSDARFGSESDMMAEPIGGSGGVNTPTPSPRRLTRAAPRASSCQLRRLAASQEPSRALTSPASSGPAKPVVIIDVIYFTFALQLCLQPEPPSIVDSYVEHDPVEGWGRVPCRRTQSRSRYDYVNECALPAANGVQPPIERSS